MNINVFVDINDNYETFPGVEDLYDLDLGSLEKLQTNILNNRIKPYLDEDGDEIMSKEDMLGFVNAEIKERNQMKDILNFFLVDTQPNDTLNEEPKIKVNSETTNYTKIDISFDKAKSTSNNDVQPHHHHHNEIINKQLPQKQNVPTQYTTITTTNNNVITNTQSVTKCTTGIKALLNKTKIDASNFQYVVGNSIVQKYAWAPDPARLKRKTISPIKSNNVHINSNSNSIVNSSNVNRSGKERNKRCIISSSNNNGIGNHSVIGASKKNEENKIVIAVPEVMHNKQKPRTHSKRYKKKKKENELYNSNKHKEDKTQLEIRQQYVVPVPTKKRAASVVVVKQEQEKEKQQKVHKEKEDKKEMCVMNNNNNKRKDEDNTVNIKGNEEEKKEDNKDNIHADSDTTQTKTFNQVELCSHQVDVCYENKNENVNVNNKQVDVDNNTDVTNKHYNENTSDLNNNMIESESTLTHLKNNMNMNDNCTSNHISFLSSNHQLSINESKDTNKNNTNILRQSKEEDEEDDVDNNNEEEENEKERTTETVNQVSVSKSHDSVQYEILKHEAKGQLDYILNFNPPQPKPQNRMIYQQDEPDLISEENEDLFTTEGNNDTTTNNTNSVLSNTKFPLNNLQTQHKEQNPKQTSVVSNIPKNNKIISPRSMFSPHSRKFISNNNNNKLSTQQQSTTDSQSLRLYRLSSTSHSNFHNNDKPQTALHRIKGTPHPNHTFYKESSQQISAKNRAHSSKPTSFPFSSLSCRLTSPPGFEIKDYSHLYKSFNELFNGHFLSSTYSQAKNYNYASTISSLYE